MKKTLSLLLVLAMMFALCACGGGDNSSPEKTLAGKWECVDGPSSFALEFKENGDAIFYMDGRSADLTWTFEGERTYEHEKTKDKVTLYMYNLHWDDTYKMVTEAGGESELMIEIAGSTLLFKKK